LLQQQEKPLNCPSLCRRYSLAASPCSMVVVGGMTPSSTYQPAHMWGVAFLVLKLDCMTPSADYLLKLNRSTYAVFLNELNATTELEVGICSILKFN
jgi:hypothetical protein